MKIFVDSANLNDLKSVIPIGIDGVTTNPSLMSKEGLSFDESCLLENAHMISTGVHKSSGSSVSVINVRDCSDKDKIVKYASHILQICQLLSVDQPVSVEVISTDHKSMVCEAENLSRISKSNVVVKLPLTYDGLVACRELSEKGIRVNLTLCFSVAQAILAARVGAAFVSPFVGRLEDAGMDGMSLVSDICSVYDNYDNFQYSGAFSPPRIIVSSIRSIKHVVDAAKYGVDSITISPKMLKQLCFHPMTESGLKIFLNDWSK